MASRITDKDALKTYLAKAPVPIILAGRKAGEIEGTAVSSLNGSSFDFTPSNSDERKEIYVTYEDDGYPIAEYDDYRGLAIKKPAPPKKSKSKKAGSKTRRGKSLRVKRTAKALRRRA